MSLVRCVVRRHLLPFGSQTLPPPNLIIDWHDGCREVLDQLIASLEHGLDGLAPRALFARRADSIVHAPVPFDQFLLDRGTRIGKSRWRILLRLSRKAQGDIERLFAPSASQLAPTDSRLASHAARAQDDCGFFAFRHGLGREHNRIAVLNRAKHGFSAK